jgi:hypothetical protein
MLRTIDPLINGLKQVWTDYGAVRRLLSNPAAVAVRKRTTLLRGP